MAGRPFFDGHTKTQLKAEIREFLKPIPFSHEFESPLLSDLIAEKHYHCSLHGLRPTKFRKLFRPGGAYDFAGYFPGHGWHLVSWTKCIDAGADEWFIVRALRDAVQPFLSDYKAAHPVCERCKQRAAEECDHVHPEFEEIAKQAIAAMSKDDRRAAELAFDWWNEDAYRLPENSSALKYVLRAHETAKLMAVCHACHLENARERRRLGNSPRPTV
jgi:hypothetical protein